LAYFALMCNKCGQWLLRELENEKQLMRYKLKCVYCNRQSTIYSGKHGWRVKYIKFYSREEALLKIKLMKDKKHIIYKWNERGGK